MLTKKVPTECNEAQRRLLSISEAAVYLGLGKSATRSYLESINAKVKIGRRTLYDKHTIDTALNTANSQVLNKEE